MSHLLEFLQSHEEAFRSQARLASLYSDFRYQRSSNPDGYQANSAAWLRALTKAANAGLIPQQSSASNRFVLHTGEELLRALETREFGRPLALGAAVEDAARNKDLIQLKEFLDAKKSVYAKSWLPTPWQVLSWGLKRLGVMGGEGVEDRLVAGDFVIMANVEAASKAVLDRAASVATSNTSRIFSKDLFISTFTSALGADSLSSTDLSVLLKHLSRDKSAVSYSPSSGVIKFKAPPEPGPTPITTEDISIANLRSLISTLEPQIQQLTTRMSSLDKAAREAVSSKQLVTAKSALRSKKLAEEQLTQRSATLTQLEEVYAKIEQAADQVELVKVMQSSSQTLKSLHAQTGGVERVQDVVEGLREEMMNVDEISAVVNEASAGAVDEGEVEDELQALEKVERETREEVERLEREKKESEEAEETRRKLAELDQMGEKKAAEAVEATSTDASAVDGGGTQEVSKTIETAAEVA